MKTKSQALAHAFADLAMQIAAVHEGDSPISKAAMKLGELQRQVLPDLESIGELRDRLQVAVSLLAEAHRLLGNAYAAPELLEQWRQAYAREIDAIATVGAPADAKAEFDAIEPVEGGDDDAL